MSTPTSAASAGVSTEPMPSVPTATSVSAGVSYEPVPLATATSSVSLAALKRKRSSSSLAGDSIEPVPTATADSSSSSFSSSSAPVSSSSSTSSSASASSYSSTTHPPKRVRLNEGTATTSASVSPSTSSDHGDDDGDDDDIQDPWAMFDGWNTLGGPKCNKEFKWKTVQPDLVELFGADSSTMKQLKGRATGVNVGLVDDKAIMVDGPSEKVDKLLEIMQQLLVVLGPAPTNYITITIQGIDINAKMTALKQCVGKLARPVAPEKLHFSVGKTSGAWSAEQVCQLAHDLGKYLNQRTTALSSNTSFLCDEVAFTNINRNIQALGVVPSDSNSPAHQAIGELQDVLGGRSGLTMVTTPHVTILNKGKTKIEGSDLKDFTTAIATANGQDGFLGPLTLEKVVVSRSTNNIKSKNRGYFTLWEMKL